MFDSPLSTKKPFFSIQDIALWIRNHLARNLVPSKPWITEKMREKGTKHVGDSALFKSSGLPDSIDVTPIPFVPTSASRATFCLARPEITRVWKNMRILRGILIHNSEDLVQLGYWSQSTGLFCNVCSVPLIKRPRVSISFLCLSVATKTHTMATGIQHARGGIPLPLLKCMLVYNHIRTQLAKCGNELGDSESPSTTIVSYLQYNGAGWFFNYTSLQHKG